MTSFLYDRIVRERVSIAWYNLQVSKQKYEADKSIYESAQRELESWENGGLKKFQEMERKRDGLTTAD